jgi:hypothetical protein
MKEEAVVSERMPGHEARGVEVFGVSASGRRALRRRQRGLLERGSDETIGAVGATQRRSTTSPAFRPPAAILGTGTAAVSRRVRVRPLDDFWELRLESPSDGPRREVFDAKWQAVTAARAWARRYAPSELVIERSDGTEQIRHRYDETTRR